MIYRSEKNSGNFTQIDKELIEDKNLTANAKGLMIYLLSKYDNWQFYKSEIYKHFTNGKKDVDKGIKELIEKGYIEVTKINNKDNGKFIYVYDIYETLKVKEEYIEDNN